MNPISTVLIADDEPSARELLEGLLSPYGYCLAVAASGAEALGQAAALNPDLALLDVMMPGMDGFEVCRRLRSDPRTAEVPVILITALDDRESRLEGIDAGADDFLSKPFDRVELRARVRTITRLNRYRRLQAERAKFEWVVQQAQDGYVALGPDGEIAYANPQAQLYLRLEASDDFPSDIRFLAQAARHYRLEPSEAWAHWPEPAPGPRYLVQPESENARAFWLLVERLEVPAGPEIQQVIRLQDVTGPMSLRRNIWKFQALVSHKLRTPLTGLLGGIEMLAMELGMDPEPGDEDEQRRQNAELAEMALLSVRQLAVDIEEIFEHLDAGDLARQGDGFRLADLEGVVARIAATLGLDSVAVSICPELQAAQLALSQPAMEQSLWQLLENARKFHPRQAPQVEVTACAGDAGQVIVRVGDDGLTLSPEQLAQVWTPYYQGEKYFTGAMPGMGLGLPMVASLVWTAGGRCRMINREGPGVVIELMLPLCPAGTPAREEITLLAT